MNEKNNNDVTNYRVTCLSKIIGQRIAVKLLGTYLDAYFQKRSSHGNSIFGPILLTGPSGVGKTLLAEVINQELGCLDPIMKDGESMTKADLYRILIKATNDQVIFIDEAHALDTKSQHVLLTALSEHKLHLPGQHHPISLANFVMILATTDEYRLKEPLRNRMRLHCDLVYYSTEEIVQIIQQKIKGLGWDYTDKTVLQMLANRSKGTPRLALNNYLQLAKDISIVHNHSAIWLEDVREAFEHLQIDEQGLNVRDRQYLQIIMRRGYASLGEISAGISLPTSTIQKVIEPYLIWAGYASKGKSYLRIITEKGLKHMTHHNR